MSETHPKPDVVKAIVEIDKRIGSEEYLCEAYEILIKALYDNGVITATCDPEDESYFDIEKYINPRLSEPTEPSDAELIVWGQANPTGSFRVYHRAVVWVLDIKGKGVVPWLFNSEMPPEARAYLLAAYKEAQS